MRGIVALALLLLALAASPAAGISGDGLLGAWHFDEAAGQTLLDASGAGRVAYLGSSPSDATADPGRVAGFLSDGALSFNGHQWATLAPTAAYQSQQLSIAFWMRSTTPDGWNALARFFEPHCYAESYVLYGEGGSLRLHVQKPDGDLVQSATLADPAPLYDGMWRHVAVTFDGHVPRLYVDGVEQTAGAPAPLSSLTPIGVFSAPQPVEIGGASACESLGITAGFVGEIDELSLWSRPLTQTEISALSMDPAEPVPEPAPLFLVTVGAAVVAAGAAIGWRRRG